MKTFSKETLLAELIERYKYLKDRNATAKRIYARIIASQPKTEGDVEQSN
jgi:hypothetical protein